MYLDVPKGFICDRLEGDHGESIYKYFYRDSSMVYITTFINTPNYNYIREQGTYYQKFETQNSGDTLLLQGVDSLGFCWKNKSFGKISVGYKRVSLKNKELYDKIINSFRRRRRR
ncbi:hypothetical protein [uncultured Microscilla sp.]|uniref:hypothetical protein n=1 Tax=uncultured Microscilla sp. TaxID=432653 RepID=UPI00260F0457|nr:hypothetical protein [uncultured Microscilla sp.]